MFNFVFFLLYLAYEELTHNGMLNFFKICHHICCTLPMRN